MLPSPQFVSRDVTQKLPGVFPPALFAPPRESSIRIVGRSAALLAALDEALRAARSSADILLEAESGTGKELLARLIHEESSRSAKPFVAINCAAVPENLLEAELFGHVRGAFTGALANRTGKFELANGGTLLLDEIGEMPLVLQPKLLRVLQEREFYRLGDTRPIQVNVRVIASTNRPLQNLVREGTVSRRPLLPAECHSADAAAAAAARRGRARAGGVLCRKVCCAAIPTSDGRFLPRGPALASLARQRSRTGQHHPPGGCVE